MGQECRLQRLLLPLQFSQAPLHGSQVELILDRGHDAIDLAPNGRQRSNSIHL